MASEASVGEPARQCPSSHSSARGGGGFLRQFLKNCVEALLASGHEPDELNAVFADICRERKRPVSPWNPSNIRHIHEYPHVITHWHRKPEFLNDEGKPRELLFDEVLALIAQVFPGANPTEIFGLLLRIRSIRQVDGRFVPGEQNVVLEGVDLWVHGLLVASSYLQTVQSNVARAAAGAGLLLERAVICPRYPVRRLLELERDWRRRGTSYAEEWDDKLERCEVPQGSSEAYTPVTFLFSLSYDVQSTNKGSDSAREES